MAQKVQVVFAADELPRQKVAPRALTFIPTWHSPFNLWLRLLQFLFTVATLIVLIIEYIDLGPFQHRLTAITDDGSYLITKQNINDLATTISAQVMNAPYKPNLVSIRGSVILEIFSMGTSFLLVVEGCVKPIGHLIPILMDFFRSGLLIVSVSLNLRAWASQDCALLINVRTVTVDESLFAEPSVVEAVGRKIMTFYGTACHLNHGINITLSILAILFLASGIYGVRVRRAVKY